MKQFVIKLIFSIIFISPLTILGQEPQEILGIAKESKTKDYYLEQSSLWKKKLDNESSNAFAWYNYYKAMRAFYQTTDMAEWNENRQQVFDKLHPIILQAKKSIGTTYEYFLMCSLTTDDKEKSFEALQKAYEIDPNRVETYEGLLTRYFVDGNLSAAKEIAQTIYRNNFYSNQAYMWNYNVLMSARGKSILFTHGDMDTLPAFVLQLEKGINTDVFIINEWLLAYQEEYREMVFSQLGVETLTKTKNDFQDIVAFKNAILEYIIDKSNDTNNIYFGCGTDVQLFKDLDIEKEMFLVGVVFQYNKSNLDNLSLTIDNFENKYNIDYLNANFQYHPHDSVIQKYLNATYIPGMNKLRNHYEMVGNKSKALKYLTLMEIIACESGREEELNSWYK